MKKEIEKGDVLKSNPLQGFWVCTIVLTYSPKNDEFNAMSHTAVTNAVFDYDFLFSDIDLSNLKIIHVDNHEDDFVPCIEIHTSKLPKEVEIIGQIDPEPLYPNKLAFEIGNGSDGGWPMCGHLNSSLGFQAVHQWRSLNDRESWLEDIATSEASHLAMLERLRNEKQ